VLPNHHGKRSAAHRQQVLGRCSFIGLEQTLGAAPPEEVGNNRGASMALCSFRASRKRSIAMAFREVRHCCSKGAGHAARKVAVYCAAAVQATCFTTRLISPSPSGGRSSFCWRIRVHAPAANTTALIISPSVDATIGGLRLQIVDFGIPIGICNLKSAFLSIMRSLRRTAGGLQ
jgi:hypothetical protein